jgi:hypothetical protein
MSTPSLDAQMIQKLALIRLLFLHGVEQAAQQEPLCLFSLMTFHDAAELFLVLAADHLGVPSQKNEPKFMDYWFLLSPKEGFPNGVNLSSKGRMEQLNRNRNAFKHAGAPPSRGAVDDAIRAATIFFEGNTEKVFGIAFEAIDMADVVPQEEVRALLKSAAAKEAAGERIEAMGDLSDAFGAVFPSNIRGKFAVYGFEDLVTSRWPEAGSELGAAFNSIAREIRSGHLQGVDGIGRRVDNHIRKLTEAVAAMQRSHRVMLLGLDYTQHSRFEALVPDVLGTGEDRRVRGVFGYAPSRDEYDFCVQFVISAALRAAELQAHRVPSSWSRRSQDMTFTPPYTRPEPSLSAKLSATSRCRELSTILLRSG